MSRRAPACSSVKLWRAVSSISVSPVRSGRGGWLWHGAAPFAVNPPASSAVLTATACSVSSAPPQLRMWITARPGMKTAAPGAVLFSVNGRSWSVTRIVP
ncbi:hypothetical protein FG91_01698 [Sphingopyxis sp. LC81]|nr:hypothetical protein FG91_01698 [Sphingopyxis sp. LC81]